MKILFSGRPAFGHMYPLLPLALAARDAGHDVRFATTGTFLPKLAAMGFATFDVGITLEAAFTAMASRAVGDGLPKGADGRPDLAVGGELFLDVMGRRTATDLAPVLARFRPDAVVYEQGEFGAAAAAHAAGIPAVLHSISPQMPPEVLGLIAGDRLGRLWDAAGVSAPTLDVFVGDVYLDIFPAALQLPGFASEPARLPLRPVAVAEPGATVPAWLGRTGRPLVYLTLGTVVATDEVLRPAIDGVAALDADVLLALGSAGGDDLGPLPGNVHVESFVDQRAVLRHADLAVHHGGSGTLLAALAAGTPQLLLPKGADQFQNSDIALAAGLATVLEPAAAVPAAIAAAATASLGALPPAAQAVRDELAAMPAPAAVVDQLVVRLDQLSRGAAA